MKKNMKCKNKKAAEAASVIGRYGIKMDEDVEARIRALQVAGCNVSDLLDRARRVADLREEIECEQSFWYDCCRPGGADCGFKGYDLGSCEGCVYGYVAARDPFRQWDGKNYREALKEAEMRLDVLLRVMERNVPFLTKRA